MLKLNIFLASTLCVVSSQSHLGFNTKHGRVETIENSPYLIKHPHSFSDFYNQIEWVQELVELKTSVRHQQVQIEKRYDDDDPEIEQKIRETNEDCIRSRNFDLQPENFLTAYPADLVPIKNGEKFEVRPIRYVFLENFINEEKEEEEEEKEKIVDGGGGGKETVNGVLPDCEAVVELPEKLEKEFIAASPPEVYTESGFVDALDVEELRLVARRLSQILSSERKQQQREEEKDIPLLVETALYHTHFFWRFRGDGLKALKCLLAFLHLRPENIPAKFQLGILLTKLGNYKKAIEQLLFVIRRLPNCIICLLPLGDAFVLDGNFSEAIAVYDKTLQLDSSLKLPLTKVSLLRCINKIFEVMENQHSNLLGTIKDVEMFKEKMQRIYKLEELVEENRASLEARRQAKLAFEHFEFGALPFANCREGIQWIGGKKERKRLFCVVSNWQKYNESVSERREKAKAEAETLAIHEFNTSPDLQKAAAERKERRASEEQREEKGRAEWKEYLARVAPFMGIGEAMDEPQLAPKYPLLKKPAKSELLFFRQNWPSTEECFRAFDAGDFDVVSAASSDLKMPELFISPENKGFFVPDFLVKYLALDRGGEALTPLPWKMPYCSPYVEDLPGGFSEKLKFIAELDSFKRLKSGHFPPSQKFAERRLKKELFKFVIHADKNNSPLGEFESELKPTLLIREIGQRIANLLRFNIAPRWLSFNLAALFFRYLGIPQEATICIEAALKCSQYEDIALTQLAQLFMRTNFSLENQKELDGVERVLSIAMHSGAQEPIPYHLIALFYYLKGNSHTAERHLIQALELDPGFKPSLELLLTWKCSKRINAKTHSQKLTLRNVYAPLCCWPNEQEIFCFDEWKAASGKIGKKRERRRRRRTAHCFRPEPLLDHPLFPVHFVYFRCNTPYTGKSYPAPSFARLLAPLFRPAAELRALKEEIQVKRFEAELALKWADSHKVPDVPVFPLDYGGFSEERVRAHQREIWPDGGGEGLRQFQIDFPQTFGNDEEKELLNFDSALEKPDEVALNWSLEKGDLKHFGEEIGRKEEKEEEESTGEKNEEEEDERRKNSNLSAKSHSSTSMKEENNRKLSSPQQEEGTVKVPSKMKETTSTTNPHKKQIDGSKLGALQSRAEVLHALDISLPEELPVPPAVMVQKGKRFVASLNRAMLKEFCQAQKKLRSQLLEQPVSTWLSPSAKGIMLDELVNMAVPEIAADLEPECPEPILVLDSGSLLLELDELSAYLYRQHLTKFYKPEKALRDTFRAIGSSRLDSVERVAARLFFALKGAPPHSSSGSSGAAPSADTRAFVLGTLSSLYWRVKGDSVNSIKCLRHSLHNSPKEFMDVPLVSLANIYQQAGFLHSALYALGKAFETGKEVVAVHFTLANVYSSIGDFPHALQFYYSTLSLQSSFEPAKTSINAIHCLTNGVLLDA